VVIDGTCAERHEQFSSGLLTSRGHEYRRGRYSLKDVDVVGNADICGNVMLIVERAAGSDRQRRRRQPRPRVGGVWRAGGKETNVGGNVGITENVFGRQDGYNGECRYMRERILFE
jgi:hypothetical protein